MYSGKKSHCLLFETRNFPYVFRPPKMQESPAQSVVLELQMNLLTAWVIAVAQKISDSSTTSLLQGPGLPDSYIFDISYMKIAYKLNQVAKY